MDAVLAAKFPGSHGVHLDSAYLLFQRLCISSGSLTQVILERDTLDQIFVVSVCMQHPLLYSHCGLCNIPIEVCEIYASQSSQILL
jgi:hypothetical protein